MSIVVSNDSSDILMCPVCYEPPEIYSVGQCDHPICHCCATRMRVLCEQMYCAICRGDLAQVVFVHLLKKYNDIDSGNCIPNGQNNILLCDNEVKDAFNALQENCCQICSHDLKFNSFELLRKHMRGTHMLLSCELCVANLKIFPFERKFYTHSDLATHRRCGDKNDTSYRGHPLCQFCDERYMDKDLLRHHLRTAHYFCHFCDTLNTNEYFATYSHLRDHFRRKHFLCTRGPCASSETRFTNAFNSDIDFKVHVAANHSDALSKAEVKELKSIDVLFDLPRKQIFHEGAISPNAEPLIPAYRCRQNRRHQRDYHANLNTPRDPDLPSVVPAGPHSSTFSLGLGDFPTLRSMSISGDSIVESKAAEDYAGSLCSQRPADALSVVATESTFGLLGTTVTCVISSKMSAMFPMPQTRISALKPAETAHGPTNKSFSVCVRDCRPFLSNPDAYNRDYPSLSDTIKKGSDSRKEIPGATPVSVWTRDLRTSSSVNLPNDSGFGHRRSDTDHAKCGSGSVTHSHKYSCSVDKGTRNHTRGLATFEGSSKGLVIDKACDSVRVPSIRCALSRGWQSMRREVCHTVGSITEQLSGVVVSAGEECCELEAQKVKWKPVSSLAFLDDDVSLNSAVEHCSGILNLKHVTTQAASFDSMSLWISLSTNSISGTKPDCPLGISLSTNSISGTKSDCPLGISLSTNSISGTRPDCPLGISLSTNSISGTRPDCPLGISLGTNSISGIKPDCPLGISSGTNSISGIKPDCPLGISSGTNTISGIKTECSLGISSVTISISGTKPEFSLGVSSDSNSMRGTKAECSLGISSGTNSISGTKPDCPLSISSGTNSISGTMPECSVLEFMDTEPQIGLLMSNEMQYKNGSAPMVENSIIQSITKKESLVFVSDSSALCFKSGLTLSRPLDSLNYMNDKVFANLCGAVHPKGPPPGFVCRVPQVLSDDLDPLTLHTDSSSAQISCAPVIPVESCQSEKENLKGKPFSNVGVIDNGVSCSSIVDNHSDSLHPKLVAEQVAEIDLKGLWSGTLIEIGNTSVECSSVQSQDMDTSTGIFSSTQSQYRYDQPSTIKESVPSMPQCGSCISLLEPSPFGLDSALSLSEVSVLPDNCTQVQSFSGSSAAYGYGDPPSIYRGLSPSAADCVSDMKTVKPETRSEINLRDLQQRSRRLAQQVRRVLGTEVRYDRFMKVSSAFRHSEIGAAAFYDECLRLFGKEEDFLSVLPEMVVQLPVTSKQHELMTVHGERPCGMLTPLPVMLCQACRQYLLYNDFIHHLSLHGHRQVDT